MTNTRLVLAVPKPQGRTRQGNGVAIFPPGITDGRSSRYKRFKEILAQLLKDIGGHPSERQFHLARCAAQLSVFAEFMEAQFAAGTPIDQIEFCTITNALQRALADMRPIRGEHDPVAMAGLMATAESMCRAGNNAYDKTSEEA